MHNGVSVTATEGVRAGPKALWFLVWGAMALFAVMSGVAPEWILAGRLGIVAGIGLAAAAAMQLALSDTRLSKREVTLSGVVVVLFVAGLLTERVLLLPARVDFSAYYVAGHVVAEHPPGRLYYQVTLSGRAELRRWIRRASGRMWVAGMEWKGFWRSCIRRFLQC